MNHLQLLGVIGADRLVFGSPILVTGLRISLIPSLLVRPGILLFNWERVIYLEQEVHLSIWICKLCFIVWPGLHTDDLVASNVRMMLSTKCISICKTQCQLKCEFAQNFTLHSLHLSFLPAKTTLMLYIHVRHTSLPEMSIFPLLNANLLS